MCHKFHDSLMAPLCWTLQLPVTLLAAVPRTMVWVSDTALLHHARNSLYIIVVTMQTHFIVAALRYYEFVLSNIYLHAHPRCLVRMQLAHASFRNDQLRWVVKFTQYRIAERYGVEKISNVSCSGSSTAIKTIHPVHGVKHGLRLRLVRPVHRFPVSSPWSYLHGPNRHLSSWYNGWPPVGVGQALFATMMRKDGDIDLQIKLRMIYPTFPFSYVRFAFSSSVWKIQHSEINAYET